MIKQVCKRDGTVVDFDENKIFSAISNAYVDVYGEITDEKDDEISAITDSVVDTLNFFTDIIFVIC